MVAPILDKIAQEYAGKLVVAKVNTDDNPSNAMAYGVQGIPTFVLLEKGREVGRLVGARPLEELRGWVEGSLSSP